MKGRDETRLHRDMTTGSITKGLLLFALPMAAGNLLPLWPLDGGRILLAVASQHLPLAQAQRLSRICAALTLALCWALAIFAACRLHLGLWPPLLAASLQLRAGRALQSEKFLAKKPGCRYNKKKYPRIHKKSRCGLPQRQKEQP